MFSTILAIGMCAWFCSCALPNQGGSSGGMIGSAIGALLASALTGLTPAGRRAKEKEKLQHEIEIAKLKKQLSNGDNLSEDDNKKVKEDNDEKTQLLNESMSDPKLVAAMSKSCEKIEDPVEKAQTAKQIDMIRCAQYDSKGNLRSIEDQNKWLSDNIPAEDLKAITDNAENKYKDTDITEKILAGIQDNSVTVTDEDIENEKKKAIEVSADLGSKLEADAAKRKEYKNKIAQLEKEKKDRQGELDKAIADAGVDEEKIKETKLAKDEYNKKMSEQIFGLKKEAATFETECSSAEFLNTINTGRKSRIEKTLNQIEEAHKKAKETLDKEITDLGGDPKNTDPKDPEDPKDPKDPKDPEPNNPKKDGDDEVYAHLDEDGDPDGSYVVKKIADENGNVKYVMRDESGDETEISKEDFENEKKRAQDYEEESNNDDEQTDDVDASDDDQDSEEVTDQQGNKKKVIKNPARVWHKKKNKTTGKSTKSYYNKKGESISAKEYSDKLKHYKERLAARQQTPGAHESLSQFLSHNNLNESAEQYAGLSDMMKNSDSSISKYME